MTTELKQEYIREIIRLDKLINENKVLLKEVKQRSVKRLIKCFITMLKEEVKSYENKYYNITSTNIYKGE